MARIVPDGDGVAIIKSAAPLANASLEGLKDLYRLAQMGDRESISQWNEYAMHQPDVARVVYSWATVEDSEQDDSRAYVHQLASKAESANPLVANDGKLITVKPPKDKLTRKGSHLIEIGKDGKRKKARKSRKKAYKAARPAVGKAAAGVLSPGPADLAPRDIANFQRRVIDEMLSDSLVSSDPRVREWAWQKSESRGTE